MDKAMREAWIPSEVRNRVVIRRLENQVPAARWLRFKGDKYSQS
jgi:hypothetical protein